MSGRAELEFFVPMIECTVLRLFATLAHGLAKPTQNYFIIYSSERGNKVSATLGIKSKLHSIHEVLIVGLINI